MKPLRKARTDGGFPSASANLQEPAGFLSLASLCNGTVNLEVSTLSVAYRFAQRHWGWPITNPVSGQYLRSDEGRLRWLGKDEKTRLCKIMRHRRCKISLPDFVLLAINTGCRNTELLGLAWKMSTSMRG